MRVIAALLCIVSQAWRVNANVEKTIFLGPGAVTLSDVRPSLDDLRLYSLSSFNSILPTQLAVQFPSKAEPHGPESWYLLSDLEEDRRYEVRICWPATVSSILEMLLRAHTDTYQSPTDFWLDTYTITQVFDTPELVASLAAYTERLSQPESDISTEKTKANRGEQSLLFLRVQAAASYYSTNRTLMDYPPPVDVDIILDPFLLNILPRSLAPVGIYITGVAIAAWFVSGYIYRWLLSVVEDTPAKAHTD
ncbi:uncharacterized protein M421DRAFT_211157 [Didymella exigua CBS 183.55]|uniref:GPI transamidase component PIG-T n=1 Tax=Didymella exigua CBS 183.55 TaxID=1150837 RepID=A0A6A5RH76_9PLEO|nr:uncharacterized protein M421DRAFT_211157 [Didymella exigua CBS 183.55]KAF1926590.1 hypothetical protein M421DRAFT_211157 [Didymella exigua CBS 183.55]